MTGGFWSPDPDPAGPVEPVAGEDGTSGEPVGNQSAKQDPTRDGPFPTPATPATPATGVAA